ncbi:hypothetical protein BC829DRAFT_383021 [Chytridium lagenaria]|nr:hypothetical protein BC829DRAFT_383021 [Chytridium lagenaria]
MMHPRLQIFLSRSFAFRAVSATPSVLSVEAVGSTALASTVLSSSFLKVAVLAAFLTFVLVTPPSLTVCTMLPWSLAFLPPR